MMRTYIKCLYAILVIMLYGLSMVGVGYAAEPDVSLVVNPKSTEILAGSGKVVITVEASGENLTFSWKLKGPGKLEDEDAAAFYTPPESIEHSSEIAIITVTVQDPSGQTMIKSTTFTIVANPDQTLPSSDTSSSQPIETGSSIRKERIRGISRKGVKAGLNMSWFGGEDSVDYDYKLGFIIGGFLTYSFNKSFAVQPEILFSMKGANTAWDETLKVNYLEIPLLLKVNMNPTGRIKPTVLLGPAIGIKLSSDVEYVKSIDIGITAGTEVEFPRGISFDVRYTSGMVTTDEDDYYDLKNRVISVMLCYSF